MKGNAVGTSIKASVTPNRWCFRSCSCFFLYAADEERFITLVLLGRYIGVGFGLDFAGIMLGGIL